MTDVTRILTNVSLVAIVAIVFAGCALLPGKNQNGVNTEATINATDPDFTNVSDDDSLEAIQAELDATVIEDEDFSELEAEFQGGVN